MSAEHADVCPPAGATGRGDYATGPVGLPEFPIATPAATLRPGVLWLDRQTVCQTNRLTDGLTAV